LDKIFITALRVDAVIGIYDWEREIRQKLLIDLEMTTDITKAAHSDDIQHALNYKAISDRVHEFASASSFGLIEALAEKVAGLVREEFAVQWVKVTVHKPGAVEAAADIAVMIERGRS
jgi:dihydroneopterin aldolase